MASLTEVAKGVVKTLSGIPENGDGGWVALATITINDVNNVEDVVEETFSYIASAGESWVKLGETMFKPSLYTAFIIR